MKRTAIKRKRSGTRRVEPTKGTTRCPDGEPLVRVTRDGREICNRTAALGRAEYRRRTEEARARQGQRCCLEGYAPMCPGYLSAEESTLEHEHGRGMGGGKRDDRMVLPDGRWQNGAAHLSCNTWKGSRFIPYNEAHNSVITPDKGATC